MQVKIFTLPIMGAQVLEDELNRFLRSHRVLQIERHFCADNGGYWAFLIEYMEGEILASPAQRKEKQNPTEGLSDEEKQRFEKMRAIRRELAEQKAVPAYTIFTDKELVQLSRLKDLRNATQADLKGIAPARIQENLRYFTEQCYGETGRLPDGEDSRQGQSA